MAEFLIKAVSAIHIDPDKDRQGCYKRGDIVVVMPDGHKWGKEERLPKFVVIKGEGVSVLDSKKYLKSNLRFVDMSNSKILRRRKWKVALDSFSPATKDKLATLGVISLPWVQFEGFIQKKGSLALKTRDVLQRATEKLKQKTYAILPDRITQIFKA